MRKSISSWYRTFAQLGFVRRKLRKGERLKQKRTLQIETMEPRVFLTAATTTTITSLTGTLAYGQSVTVAAQVSEVSPNTGTPAGTVDFLDGTTNLGPGALDGSGCTSLTTSSLTAGTHSITAAYEGYGDDAGSTSTPIYPYVEQATPTVTINSPASAICNQSITLAGSVSAGLTGDGVVAPTGSVTLYDWGSYLNSVSLDAGSFSFQTSSLSLGSHYITASYSGDGNYTSNTSSSGQYIDVELASTTTTLSSDPSSSSVYGQSITLTAGVSSSYGTPSGSVDFYDSTTNTDLGSASLNSGSAILPRLNLGIGGHNITATYESDGTFASSSSSISQTVQMSTTTTIADSAPNPSRYGDSVMFTASVTVDSPGSGTPTGYVTFYDGASWLGSAWLDASGNASVTTSNLGIGSHSVTACYNGDGNFVGSSSLSHTQTVDAATTTTIASSSPNPSVYGQSITLTATASADTWGVGTPTGSVDFVDTTTNTNLGWASLDPWGNASFQTSALLLVGGHSITASYAGYGNFAPSSASISQEVNQAASEVTVIPPANSSNYGDLITLTATVTFYDGTGYVGTGTLSGMSAPTGTVTFYNEGGYLGSDTLDVPGTWSLTTSSLPVGCDSITAVYSGDTNFVGSSGSVLQTVQATTTTTIVSCPSSTYGQPITLTATISGLGPTPGYGQSAGSVDFYDSTSGTDLGSATLDNMGSASLTTSTLMPGGQNSITATYSGDATSAGSTSPAVGLVVEQATPVVDIGTETNYPVYGQPVTLTATVSVWTNGSPTGGGQPSGTVTFYD